MTKRIQKKTSKPAAKQVVETALRQTPNDARLVLQSAQMYRDHQDLPNALAAFDHRSRLAGLDQEVYASLWLGARVAGQLGHPQPDVIARYLRAFEFRPNRHEALGDLARYLRESSPQWNLAHLLMQRAINLPPTSDLVMVEPEWQQWRCQDEFGVAAYWVGEYDTCRRSCELLLAGSLLPRAHRDRVLANLNFARVKMKLPSLLVYP